MTNKKPPCDGRLSVIINLYHDKVARRDKEKTYQREYDDYRDLMQSVYPYRYPSPEREWRVPVVFAQPRKQRFFLGIQYYRSCRAEQHIADGGEYRIIVRRGKSARFADHKFSDKIQRAVACECRFVVNVDIHKCVVDNYYHYSQKQTYARGYHLFVTAKRIYKPPEKYRKCKHMQYAELYRLVHKIRDYGDDGGDYSRLYAALEVVSGKRAGYTAQQSEYPYDDILRSMAQSGILII